MAHKPICLLLIISIIILASIPAEASKYIFLNVAQKTGNELIYDVGIHVKEEPINASVELGNYQQRYTFRHTDRNGKLYHDFRVDHWKVGDMVRADRMDLATTYKEGRWFAKADVYGKTDATFQETVYGAGYTIPISEGLFIDVGGSIRNKNSSADFWCFSTIRYNTKVYDRITLAGKTDIYQSSGWDTRGRAEATYPLNGNLDLSIRSDINYNPVSHKVEFDNRVGFLLKIK